MDNRYFDFDEEPVDVPAVALANVGLKCDRGCSV